MSANFDQFKALHTGEELLLLGNVWDAQSAAVLEQLSVKAIGTSSAAVAATLGYNDGEGMPFEEYYFIIKRIKAASSLPLSVDLEAGYGGSEEEIVRNIARLHQLGVAGVNIEDSVVDSKGRSIVSAEAFAEKLQGITRRLQEQQVDMFINVRCDAFLLGLPDARKAAVERIGAYDKTGVHGIFLPCITAAEDIRAATAATQLPVSVMCMPGLPDFRVLQSLGVKRVSMGNFVHSAIYKKMEGMISRIIDDLHFGVLFQ